MASDLPDYERVVADLERLSGKRSETMNLGVARTALLADALRLLLAMREDFDLASRWALGFELGKLTPDACDNLMAARERLGIR